MCLNKLEKAENIVKPREAFNHSKQHRISIDSTILVILINFCSEGDWVPFSAMSWA